MLYSSFCFERKLCFFSNKICWPAKSLGFSVFLFYVLMTSVCELVTAETVYFLLCLYRASHNGNPVLTGGILENAILEGLCNL